MDLTPDSSQVALNDPQDRIWKGMQQIFGGNADAINQHDSTYYYPIYDSDEEQAANITPEKIQAMEQLAQSIPEARFKNTDHGPMIEFNPDFPLE